VTGLEANRPDPHPGRARFTAQESRRRLVCNVAATAHVAADHAFRIAEQLAGLPSDRTARLPVLMTVVPNRRRTIRPLSAHAQCLAHRPACSCRSAPPSRVRRAGSRQERIAAGANLRREFIRNDAIACRPRNSSSSSRPPRMPFSQMYDHFLILGRGPIESTTIYVCTNAVGLI
jgi:hypothetical protein